MEEIFEDYEKNYMLQLPPSSNPGIERLWKDKKAIERLEDYVKDWKILEILEDDDMKSILWFVLPHLSFNPSSRRHLLIFLPF